MSTAPIRYQSADEDSARWAGFEFREGDIVISTRSESGTTWMQMICALLVFRTPDLPTPLGELSPWLDWRAASSDDVFALLAAQQHRRIIKTHTPLDGIPLDPRATYIVVARHPLDAAVSLYHLPQDTAARPPLRDWLIRWIDDDADPRAKMDSLPGVLWHLSDAWARRAEPNVVIVHYADLVADLETQMRQLAALLEITVPGPAWPGLVQAATFDQTRAGAGPIPGPPEQLTGAELAHYDARAATMAPRDLLTWLHR